MKESIFSKGQRVEVKGGYGTQFTVYDPCEDLLVEVMGDDGRSYSYNQSDLVPVPQIKNAALVIKGKVVAFKLAYSLDYGTTEIHVCYQ